MPHGKLFLLLPPWIQKNYDRVWGAWGVVMLWALPGLGVRAGISARFSK